MEESEKSESHAHAGHKLHMVPRVQAVLSKAAKAFCAPGQNRGTRHGFLSLVGTRKFVERYDEILHEAITVHQRSRDGGGHDGGGGTMDAMANDGGYPG